MNQNVPLNKLFDKINFEQLRAELENRKGQYLVFCKEDFAKQVRAMAEKQQLQVLEDE